MDGDTSSDSTRPNATLGFLGFDDDTMKTQTDSNSLGLNDKFETLMTMMANMHKETQNAIHTNISEMNTKINETIETKLNDIRQEISSTNDKFNKLYNDLSDNQNKLNIKTSQIESQVNAVENDLRKQNTKIDDLSTEIITHKNEVDVKNDTVKSVIRGEISTNYKKVKDNTEKIRDECNSNVSALKGELNKFDHRLGNLNTKISEKIESVNERINGIVCKGVGLDSDILLEHLTPVVDKEMNKLKTQIGIDVVSVKTYVDNKLQTIEDKWSNSDKHVNNGPELHKSIINADAMLLDFDTVGTDVHPMCFLELAKRYVHMCSDPWEAKCLNIVRHLKGEAGRWGRINNTKWSSFEAFSLAFKRKFWSMNEQKRFENFLMSSGNYVFGKTNLVSYVMENYNQNEYLDHKLDNETFLAYISKHVPRVISSTIATAKIKGAEDLEQLLIQLTQIEHDDTVNRMRRVERPTANERHFENNRNYRPPHPGRNDQYRQNTQTNVTRIRENYRPNNSGDNRSDEREINHMWRQGQGEGRSRPYEDERGARYVRQRDTSSQ